MTNAAIFLYAASYLLTDTRLSPMMSSNDVDPSVREMMAIKYRVVYYITKQCREFCDRREPHHFVCRFLRTYHKDVLSYRPPLLLRPPVPNIRLYEAAVINDTNICSASVSFHNQPQMYSADCVDPIDTNVHLAEARLVQSYSELEEIECNLTQTRHATESDVVVTTQSATVCSPVMYSQECCEVDALMEVNESTFSPAFPKPVWELVNLYPEPINLTVIKSSHVSTPAESVLVTASLHSSNAKVTESSAVLSNAAPINSKLLCMYTSNISHCKLQNTACWLPVMYIPVYITNLLTAYAIHLSLGVTYSCALSTLMSYVQAQTIPLMLSRKVFDPGIV